MILWGQVCSSGRPNFFQRTIGSSFFLVGARARRPMFFYPQVVTVTSNFEKDQTLTSNFVFSFRNGEKDQTLTSNFLNEIGRKTTRNLENYYQHNI